MAGESTGESGGELRLERGAMADIYRQVLTGRMGMAVKDEWVGHARVLHVYDQACMCDFRHGEDYWDVTPANRHIVYTLQEDDDDPDQFNLACRRRGSSGAPAHSPCASGAG
jgi:hypothetical protein